MYKQGKKYNIKYANTEGKVCETEITPDTDMNTPQLINKLKEKEQDFFKLLENKCIEDKGDNNMFEVSELKQRAQQVLPKEDIDVHNGDLYLKVSDKSKELLQNLKNNKNGLINKFKSPVDNAWWFEIPFANMEDDYKSKQTESYKFFYGDVLEESKNIDSLDKYNALAKEDKEQLIKNYLKN